MAGKNQRNGEDFAKRMQQRAAEIERSATRIQRGAALVLDRAIVLATPVDTGRARANTIVSTPGPDYGLVEHATGSGGAAAQAALGKKAEGQA